MYMNNSTTAFITLIYQPNSLLAVATSHGCSFAYSIRGHAHLSIIHSSLWSIADNQWLIPVCFNSFPEKRFSSQFANAAENVFSQVACSISSASSQQRQPHSTPPTNISNTLHTSTLRSWSRKQAAHLQLKVLACARECESISGQSKCQAKQQLPAGEREQKVPQTKNTLFCGAGRK